MEMKSLQAMLGAKPNEIRQQRVRNFTTSAETESRRLIEDLKSDIRKRETELMQSLDVNPTASTDLASKLSTVDAGSMVAHILQTRYDIKVLTEQLESYVSTHNFLFPKSPITSDLYNEIEEDTNSEEDK